MSSTRRLAAIMFTDLQGFTSETQRNEAESLRMLEDQARLVEPVVAASRGRLIKTMGDGLLVEFSNALDAVECSVSLQRAIHERNSRVDGPPLRLRIGLHLGDVQERGADILGDAVNIASRIEHLAETGGVCTSSQIYDQVRNKVPYQFERLGPRPLKGVLEPVDTYRIVLPWVNSAQSAAVTHPHRVAVLPFANISPDPSDAYIADGMTEELIATMSRISGLSVLARTSVQRYRDGTRNVEEIARELKAGTILEGSVRKSQDKIRVTVQAIDSETSSHLWSESYDREMKDLFAIEADIAQTVADAVKVRLASGERAKVQAEPTRNPEAHALYLRGVAYNTTDYGRESSLLSSIKCFRRAIEIDPAYASAYAWLADSYLSLYLLGALPAETAWAEGESAATKALELDASDSDAHAALLALKFYQGDMVGSEREARTALELNPNNTYNHSYYAGLLATTGRVEEALVQARIALELAPLDRFANEMLVWVLKNNRRFVEAIAVLLRILEFDPAHIEFRTGLGECYMGVSQVAEAVSEFRKAEEIQRTDLTRSNLAWALARAGESTEASQILDDLTRLSESRTVAYHCVTQAQVALGHLDAAYALWEKALAENNLRRLESLSFSLRTSSAYDGLRADPRFIILLQRVGAGAHPSTLTSEHLTESR
ncbi:MAG TPA: adenylate/guanylate cyclase domain-containing protein [Thermoplasmata archaeon]|nr:adenylate/guanylate cyclase domain-containing protein [Thermoplasmata archaeon]